jgi:hypothetical protein
MRQGRSGMVVLVGATALTLVALAGAALGGLRPGGETAVPPTVSTRSGVSEGVLPKGGLAEQYDEQRRAAGEAVTPRGGMAEFYAEREAESRVAATWESRMGGMAELYRDQERARLAVAQ